MITAPLPDGFCLRPATMDDLEAVLELQIAHDIADFDEPHTTRDGLRATWQSPDINLKTDTWVVEIPDGPIVSYACIRGRPLVRLIITVWVRSDYRGYGLGSHLLQVAETSARTRIAKAQPAGPIMLAAVWISERNQAAQHLLQRAGYQKTYTFSCMQLNLTMLPPVPIWPGSITVRPFDPEKDRQALYEVDEEISQDERGHIPRTFEEWQRQNLADPTLIFVAWDADRIAGLVIGQAANDHGWIWHLGVRRPWRRQGLGMAFLQHIQRAFYRRGLRTMNLNVETLNASGASRLYEQAGMHTLFQYHRYEIPVHPPEQPENRSFFVDDKK